MNGKKKDILLTHVFPQLSRRCAPCLKLESLGMLLLIIIIRKEQAVVGMISIFFFIIPFANVWKAVLTYTVAN